MSNGNILKWQDNQLSAAERNIYILDNEILTDVVFKFLKTNETIEAHKFELAKGSSFFYNLFFESDGNPDGNPVKVNPIEINVLNFKKNSYIQVIRYIYTKEIKFVDLTVNNVTEILNLANTLQLSSLKMECIELLMKQLLDINKFFESIKICLKDDCLKEVFAAGFKMIQNETERYISLPSFLDVDKELIKLILESDVLNCSEYELYKAVIDWSKQDCMKRGVKTNGFNRKQSLGDLIYLIRFPVMSIDEFTKCTAEFNTFLTTEEYGQIFQFISSNKCRNSSKFSSKYRSYPCESVNPQFELILQDSLAEKRREIYKNSFFVFTVDTKVFFMGFKSYISAKTISHTIYIYNNKNLITQLKNQRNSHVMLKHPILINPGSRVSICFQWDLELMNGRVYNYETDYFQQDVKFEILHGRVHRLNGRIEKLFFKNID